MISSCDCNCLQLAAHSQTPRHPKPYTLTLTNRKHRRHEVKGLRHTIPLPPLLIQNHVRCVQKPRLSQRHRSLCKRTHGSAQTR